MGADMLFIGREDRPLLTSTVAKMSQGASEVINIFSVKYIQQFLNGKRVFIN